MFDWNRTDGACEDMWLLFPQRLITGLRLLSGTRHGPTIDTGRPSSPRKHSSEIPPTPYRTSNLAVTARNPKKPEPHHKSGTADTMGSQNPYLHLARPLAPAPTTTTPASTAPLSVTVQPQALLSILDHASRRPADQDRVIGTLLGTRSDDGTEVSITNCYAVPHTETAEQVEVDMDYQKRMLELHLRVAPKEVLVGWYATSAELNTFSALIQNFYSQQGEGTWPFPAVHLTVDCRATVSTDVHAQAYISAPIGVTAERAADSCLFIPVPHEIRYGGEAEKSGLEAIAAARDREDRTVPLLSDVEVLERGIEHVLELLERVSGYVSNVLDEEAEPSPALGQFLLNTLSLAPKVSAEEIERDFNAHVQDVLLVAYLANTIRTQIDLSNRLATAALTMGGGGGVAGETGIGSGEQKSGRQQGGTRGQQGVGGSGGRRGEQ